MSHNPMSSLISTINKLQDAFNLLGYDPLSLPQICVVGGQSSGKSSVLENIVGKDFLPRGSGIVTRRPLVMQLIHQEGSEYAEFLHIPDRQFYDFEEVRREIAAVTDKETGTNKGISEKPINVKIFSDKVVNLTLVDLPGITRVAVGDQPKNIEEIIRRMVLKFVRPKNAIILAVTAANTDVANSDALQMAKEVDPEGHRTVGVITKLDIMDRGTDAMEVLEGQIIPLRLGYIGVINRAQADIEGGKKIEAQWKAEQEFFETHPAYSAISHKCGTPFLTKTLNKILVQHIRSCLPEIVEKITEFMGSKRKELATLMELGDSSAKGRVVLKSLSSFTEQFRSILQGDAEDVPTTELYGGARIAYIFQTQFKEAVWDMDIKDQFSHRELRTTMQNCMGMRGSLFISDASFEVLIKKAIRSLDGPCKRCLQNVYDELVNIMTRIITPEMKRFATLRIKIHDAVLEMLKKKLEPSTVLITTLIKMETSRINLDHPHFVNKDGDVSALMQEVTEEVDTGMKINESMPTPGGPPPPSSMGGNPPAPPPKPMKPPKPGPGSPIAAPRPQTASERRRHHHHRAPPPDPTKKKPVGSSMVEQPLSHREKIETEVIRRLLGSYFDIVRTRLVDTVPKAITFALINEIVEDIHDALVTTLYKDDMIDVLLEESPEIKTKREKCKEVLKLMESSMRAITDVQASTDFL